MTFAVCLSICLSYSPLDVCIYTSMYIYSARCIYCVRAYRGGAEADGRAEDPFEAAACGASFFFFLFFFASDSSSSSSYSQQYPSAPSANLLFSPHLGALIEHWPPPSRILFYSSRYKIYIQENFSKTLNFFFFFFQVKTHFFFE